MPPAARLPGVNSELAAAVRRINALHAAHPEPRPDIGGNAWRDCEKAIDHAAAVGDPAKALAAVEAWEQHARRVLGAGS